VCRYMPDRLHSSRENDSGFEAAPQLYINPDECIDCNLCATVCPVSAIYQEDDLPAKWKKFIQINADWFVSNKP